MTSINMRGIARRARVSPSTVSVVLNRTPHVPVAEATRRKVLAAANSLGYQQAFLSRAIKTPLRHVGIAVGDLVLAQESFTAVIFRGVHQHLHSRGYSALLQPVGEYVAEDKADTVSVPARVAELHRSRLIDGVVIDKQYFLNDEVERMFRADVPLVTVNAGQQILSDGRKVPAVTLDDYAAGKLAVGHLLELGHRRIGYVGRPWAFGPRAFRSTPVYEFGRAFKETLADAGLPSDDSLIVEGDLLDRATSYAAVDKLFGLTSPPTALVVGDDQIAVMVINALRRHGLSVPGDVSVIGYGDLAMVERLIEPGLTTVHAPLVENGARAAEMLIDLVEGREIEQPQVVLEPRLVVRDSTRKASV